MAEKQPRRKYEFLQQRIVDAERVALTRTLNSSVFETRSVALPRRSNTGRCSRLVHSRRTSPNSLIDVAPSFLVLRHVAPSLHHSSTGVLASFAGPLLACSIQWACRSTALEG